MKKKLLAILLTLAMVVTMIPAVFVTVTAEAAFVPKDDAWFTERGYTPITDEAGLKAVASGASDQAINKYYLKGNIVVSGNGPLLNADLKNFEIDGNGKTISNVNATTPTAGTWPKLGALAARVYENVTIKNLNMSGSVSYTTETTNPLEIGGLFGTISAANGTTTVENVHLNMNVTSGKNTYTGGLVGQAIGLVEIENCTVTGNVTAGGNNVGGLIGYLNVTTLTMEDCEYNGTLTVTGGSAEPNVGGIIGLCKATSSATLTRVVRKGNIVESNKEGGVGTGWARVGGFIGRADSGAWDLDVVDCKSYGNITGTNDLGGFVGLYYTKDTDTSTFENCENYADAAAKNTYAGFIAYVNSGDAVVNLVNCANHADLSTSTNELAGFIRKINSNGNVTLSGCVNYGDLTGTSTGTLKFGGMIGYATNAASNVTIDGCVNYGSITGTSYGSYKYIGGLFGDVEKITGTLTIQNSANFGDVTALGGQPSGILGGIHVAPKVVIQDCYNYGNITNQQVARSEFGAAGIVFHVENADDLDIIRCHNFGKISSAVNGYSKASGIFGATQQDTTNKASVMDIDITNCSNFGVLEVYDYNQSSDDVYAPEFCGIACAMAANKAADGSTLDITGCYSNGVVIESARAEATKTANGWTAAFGGAKAIVNGIKAGTVTDCVSAHQLADGTLCGSFGAVNTSGNIEMIVSTKMNDVVSTLGNAFVLDGEQLEPVYALNTPATQVFATQEANKTSTTVDVRVLALVNSLNYDNAGVRIYNADKSKNIEKTTTTVYTGVVDTTEGIVDAPYGTYYLPITVNGVSTTGTYTFIVETFVEKGAVETAGATYTVVVDNGVVSAKKN